MYEVVQDFIYCIRADSKKKFKLMRYLRSEKERLKQNQTKSEFFLTYMSGVGISLNRHVKLQTTLPSSPRDF